MKCKVWTRYTSISRTKCIFNGEISILPNKDTGIVVRSGFCVEKIDRIYYDFTDESVEIHVSTEDANNEYGPCLLYPDMV